MTAQAIVYTGTINGIAVRFVAPLSEADMMPWIVAKDIVRAVGIDRHMRRAIEKAITSPDVAKDVILAGAGRTTVLGFQAIQGLMRACRDIGLSPPHMEYVEQVTTAAEVLYPHLFDRDEQGGYLISSTVVARLLGEDHEKHVARIETGIATDWYNGPLH